MNSPPPACNERPQQWAAMHSPRCRSGSNACRCAKVVSCLERILSTRKRVHQYFSMLLEVCVCDTPVAPRIVLCTRTQPYHWAKRSKTSLIIEQRDEAPSGA